MTRRWSIALATALIAAETSWPTARPAPAPSPSSPSSPRITAVATTRRRPPPREAPHFLFAMPRPDVHRKGAVSAADVNGDCVGCHSTIAAEWESSRHHGSATDPMYLRALAGEPIEFCRPCHVPEAPDDDGPPVAPNQRLGVGCVTCHLVDSEEVLAAPGKTHEAAPHPVLAVAGFATADACANCHEFTFPGDSEDPHGLMQSTIAEAITLRSNDTCATCHMPTVMVDGETHRSHRFAVEGDAALLASALRIDACRASLSRVRISMSLGHVGHAVPTGDIFRRLAVRLTAGSASATITLGRKVIPPAADDRVGVHGPGPSIVEFALEGLAPDAPLEWFVEQRAGENAHGKSVMPIARTSVLGRGTIAAVGCP